MRILSRGAIETLTFEARRIGLNNKLLIVTGSQSSAHPAIKDVISHLQQAFECTHYSVRSWLATIEEYESFKLEFDAFEPGCLIAIGGGRVMDFAKLIGSGLQADIVRQKVQMNQPIERKVPLVAVPTTAGSGAEATPYAVFYFSGEKSTISHPSFLPDSEIIDPNLLSSLSPYQLAISGADAICQAIESVFSPSATAQTLLISQSAFTIAIPALKACVNGQLEEFGELLCLASNLAGQAITHVRTNVPHALSYYLTSHYDVPHGQAVAFYIGAYLEDALAKVKTLAPEGELFKTCQALERCLGVTASNPVQNAWQNYLKDIGLESSFAHFAAVKIRDGIEKSANIERLKNLAVPLDIKAIIAKSICEKE